MKVPEMKHLFFSTLFACIPAQAATTLFDNFTGGLSTDKYQGKSENLKFSAGMQGYLKKSGPNKLGLIDDDTSLRQQPFIERRCNPSISTIFCEFPITRNHWISKEQPEVIGG